MSTALIFAVFGLSGIASGFCAGLFGIGGGLIMVPVLVYAFKATGMAPNHVVAMALGTSMAAIVFSSAQSAYGHYRKGSASAEKIRLAAPWVVAGVLIGGAIAVRIPTRPLLILVGSFQLFAALLMLSDISKVVALRARIRTAICFPASHANLVNCFLEHLNREAPAMLVAVFPRGLFLAIRPTADGFAQGFIRNSTSQALRCAMTERMHRRFVAILDPNLAQELAQPLAGRVLSASNQRPRDLLCQMG